jgi:hypothetical protein
VCKKNLFAEPGCPRCGADLGTLHALEAQAAGLAVRGLALLARGELTGAEAALRASLRLKDTPETRRALALCQTLPARLKPVLKN